MKLTNLKTIIPIAVAVACASIVAALSIKKYVDKKKYIVSDVTQEPEKLPSVSGEVEEANIKELKSEPEFIDLMRPPTPAVFDMYCDPIKCNCASNEEVHGENDMNEEILDQPTQEPQPQIISDEKDVKAASGDPKCYIISFNEFCDTDYDRYTKLMWTYFTQDGVMADENDELVEDMSIGISGTAWSNIVGPMLTQAKNGMRFVSLYVRNEATATDVEISIRRASYHEAILGEPDDIRDWEVNYNVALNENEY